MAATAVVGVQSAAAQDDGWQFDESVPVEATVHPGGEASGEIGGAANTLVTNGDFETGDLTGWTSINLGGPAPDGFPVVTYSGSTLCPTTTTGVPPGPPPPISPLPAPSGDYGACFGQWNSSSHILYQDVALPTDEDCTLIFDHWYSNEAADWVDGPLNLIPPTQIYRVDILDPSAAADSVAAGDVLVPVFKPAPGDPLTPGDAYVRVETDVSDYKGQTVRVRFAQADTTNYQTVGIDNVAVVCPPPSPTNLVVSVPKATEGSTLPVSWTEPVGQDPADPVVSYTVAADAQSEVVAAASGDLSAAATKSATLTNVDRSVAQTVTVTATTKFGQTSSASVVAKSLQSRIYVANRIASGPADYNFLFAPPGAAVVTGDWNADGHTGFASRVGNVFTLVDERGNPQGSAGYGKPTDEIYIGDWNANGQDTFGVRRGNIFYLRNTPTSGPADIVLGYGKVGDEVFVGDWNGNGQDTFAVRRGNTFYVRNSTTSGPADVVFGYGKAGDEVLVGDWDQDGIDTFAVRRGNMIFIRNDFQSGVAEQTIAYGKAGDTLLVGDYNADGVDTFAVRRLEEKK